MSFTNTIIKDIEEVIKRKVRPSLLEHEGDVEVLSFEDGICRVRLLGRCANCPSASLTTEELIGKNVMEEIPEVKDVILVQEVSDDIMDFARDLIRRHHEEEGKE